MGIMTVRLPHSVHEQIKKLCISEGVSMNQFLVIAAAEKISSLMTVDFLKSEAALADQADFEAVLRAVPASDKIPDTDLIMA